MQKYIIFYFCQVVFSCTLLFLILLVLQKNIDYNNLLEKNQTVVTVTNDSKAWKRFTSFPNSFVRILPARAMDVVRNVVGTLRNEKRVILITPNGGLRGKILAFKSGKPGNYFSFKGIRYGQPPIGDRRFRSAIPEQAWGGIRNALKEGNPCPHRNVLLDTYKGNEDCLFLNVYTKYLPNKNSHPQLPVMVWIHGGGFTFGSANAFLYGPDYLIGEDVVLVTINYRLGALGFLSVGTNQASGNAGLKDQILALKWIQENIAAFGGDPNQVTIFGQSAGAASVHYLMLSPLSLGLFHRAILESGTALNPWAIEENPKKRAFRLGQLLGIYTNDTGYLIDELRKLPARKLIDNAEATLTDEDARNNIGLPFVPCIEEENNEFDLPIENYDFDILNDIRDEPIITKHPIELLRKGSFVEMPAIFGYNSHEAMLFMRKLKKNPKLLETIDKDFIRLVPRDLNIPGGKESVEGQLLANKIRDLYIGPRSISDDTIEEMIYLLTDIMFFRGIIDSARFQALETINSTYFYRFNFDGTLGLYKRLMGISRQGVCHGDELGYLFHFGFFNLSLDSQSIEILVKRRMVTMWTNFAKYGNPTPLGRDDPILSVNWKPLDISDIPNTLPYLDITGSLETKINPETKRLQFWDEIYSKYNGN